MSEKNVTDILRGADAQTMKRLTLVIRRATSSALRLSDSEYTDKINEVRADWGEAAIAAGDPDWGDSEIHESVSDAIANICHALMRMGLTPAVVLDSGYKSFEADNRYDHPHGNIGSGTPVAHNKIRFPSPEYIPRTL